MLENIKPIINKFLSISLKEMNSVSLMKRTDTKFVINKSQLVFILESIKEDYRVLQIKDDRIMSYSSLYFDTQENKFYRRQHASRCHVNQRIQSTSPTVHYRPYFHRVYYNGCC